MYLLLTEIKFSNGRLILIIHYSRLSRTIESLQQFCGKSRISIRLPKEHGLLFLGSY